MNESFEALNKLMSQDGSVFEQFLSEIAIDQAIKANPGELKKYLSRHLPRLLRAAFRDDNTDNTMKALKLLTYGNSFVIPNLVKSTFFPEFAFKFLTHESLSNRRIGRICDVTISIFQSCVKDILKNCSYILMLFKYCENLSVFNLFSSIFTEDDKYSEIQDWLFEIGFANELADMLSEALKKNYTTTYSTDQEKLITLIKIVTEVAKNKKTRNRILESCVLNVFKQVHTTLPPMIMNSYWEAVNVMYDKGREQIFKAHAVAAKNLMILSSSPGDRIYIHAEALNFLSKVIDTNTYMVDQTFIKGILGLMISFCKSSYFLCECRHFFKVCIGIKDLQEQTVKVVVPFLLKETQMKDHGLISIFANAIIEDITKNDSANKVLRKVDGAPKFVKGKLEPLIKIRDNDFGGEYNKKDSQPPSSKKPSFWQTFYPKST